MDDLEGNDPIFVDETNENNENADPLEDPLEDPLQEPAQEGGSSSNKAIESKENDNLNSSKEIRTEKNGHEQPQEDVNKKSEKIKRQVHDVVNDEVI